MKPDLHDKRTYNSKNYSIENTNIMKLKKKLNMRSNIKKALNKTRNEINKLQNVKIEYLELRNIKNLKISNKLKNSKIFVSFYINNVRLIDNF